MDAHLEQAVKHPVVNFFIFLKRWVNCDLRAVIRPTIYQITATVNKWAYQLDFQKGLIAPFHARLELFRK